jgi:recombination endonuclease VII
MPTKTTKTPRRTRRVPTPRAVATALRIQGERNGYAITVEERDRRFDEQAHRCAVCNRPFRTPSWHLVCTFEGTLEGRRIGTSPAVDHDHNTGLVRGLLCRFCNRYVVSMIERFPEWVAQARVYVSQGGWRRP